MNTNTGPSINSNLADDNEQNLNLEEKKIDITDHASSAAKSLKSELSQSGFETVVFRQEYPENPNTTLVQQTLVYSSILGFLLGIQYIMIGVQFVRIYQNSILDFSGIVLGLFVVALMKFILEFVYCFIIKIQTDMHLTSMFNWISYMGIYGSIYGLLAGYLSPAHFINGIAFSFGFKVFVVQASQQTKNSISSLTSIFFEYSPILLICLKVVYPNIWYSWSFAFFVYTFFYYSLIIFCVFLTWAFLVMTGLYIGGHPKVIDLKKENLISLDYFWVALSNVTLSLVLIYNFMRKFLENNLIYPVHLETVDVPDEMFQAGVLMIILFVIVVTVLGAANMFFRPQLIRAMTSSAGREVLLKNYHKAVKIGLNHLSGNLLKTGAADENDENKKSDLVTECVICQTKPCTYFFSPCNHLVSCDDCTKSYLESHNYCPLCKETIQKAMKIGKKTEDGSLEVDTVMKIRVI